VKEWCEAGGVITDKPHLISLTEHSQKKRYKSCHWGGTFSKGTLLYLKGAYWYLNGTNMYLLKRYHPSDSFCTFFSECSAVINTTSYGGKGKRKCFSFDSQFPSEMHSYKPPPSIQYSVFALLVCLCSFLCARLQHVSSLACVDILLEFVIFSHKLYFGKLLQYNLCASLELRLAKYNCVCGAKNVLF